MQNPSEDFLRQLLDKGIDFTPHQVVGDDVVMADEQMLSLVSAAWGGQSKPIIAVVQSRINSIGREILLTCDALEVPLLRKVVIELAAILTDFERYAGELERRKAAGKEDKTTY